MMKKEIKMCGICKLGIDPEKEFFKGISYKNEDEILSEAYYHINCFREKMSGGGKLQVVQNKAMEILNKMSEKVS